MRRNRYNNRYLSMPQKRLHIPINGAATKSRPTQDLTTVGKQVDQFPSVGMTLRSYQNPPLNDKRGRRAQAQPNTPGRLKRMWRKITLKRVVLTVLLLVLLSGGWLGYKFAHNAHKLFGGNILSVLHTTKLKGEDNGRVTVLLAGNSADDPGHNGANLTDSIMLMSLDTKNNKAFLLSIPRDLYVKIGNYSHAKINEAYVDGQSNDFDDSGYPGGGMGQLEKIVSEDFGIDINYYGLINYNALKEAVDAVGGVDVTIKSNDPRGLYDPNIDYATHGPLVKLTNGAHHLTGEQALDLSRARGDAYNSYGFAGSDFDRTQHQRDLLVALKSKVTSAGVISSPTKLSSLSDAIGNNVKTDFSGPEIHRFYDLIKKVDSGNIASLSLNQANGKNLLSSYTTSQGQSALIPTAGLDDFSGIQAFINRQTSSNPVVQEGASIVVLNGTNTSGLAAKGNAKITAQNMIVSKVGDAGLGTQATTSIIDNSAGKKPNTSAALVKLFGPHLTTQNSFANLYTADFIIVMGSDQVPTTTTTPATQSSGN